VPRATRAAASTADSGAVLAAHKERADYPRPLKSGLRAVGAGDRSDPLVDAPMRSAGTAAAVAELPDRSPERLRSCTPRSLNRGSAVGRTVVAGS